MEVFVLQQVCQNKDDIMVVRAHPEVYLRPEAVVDAALQLRSYPEDQIDTSKHNIISCWLHDSDVAEPLCMREYPNEEVRQRSRSKVLKELEEAKELTLLFEDIDNRDNGPFFNVINLVKVTE